MSTRTETKGERKRTATTRQNTANSKKLHHKLFPLNRLLFSKRGLIGVFFLCSGMKIDFFYCQLEVNNNHPYSFGHKEKVDLFVLL